MVGSSAITSSLQVASGLPASAQALAQELELELELEQAAWPAS
jgi:hypothetical protein